MSRVAWSKYLLAESTLILRRYSFGTGKATEDVRVCSLLGHRCAETGGDHGEDDEGEYSGFHDDMRI